MLSAWMILALAQVPVFRGPGPHPVQVEVGGSVVVKVPGLQRIAISGGCCWDVKTVGNDEVQFFGYEPGRSNALLWTGEGRRLVLDVTVVKRRQGDVPVPTTTREQAVTVVDSAGVREQPMTIVEIPESLSDVREERAPDGGVVLVGRNPQGQKVTITLTPYRPRPRRADAGAP